MDKKNSRRLRKQPLEILEQKSISLIALSRIRGPALIYPRDLLISSLANRVESERSNHFSCTGFAGLAELSF